MKFVLTFLSSILFVFNLAAQKTIMVKAEDAASTLKNLEAGEYNVVVKGNLKGVLQWDSNGFAIQRWGIKNNVSIKTLDLSKCFGLDSIQGFWITHLVKWEYETLSGMIETKEIEEQIVCDKIILPDDLKYVGIPLFCAREMVVTPKNRFLSYKNGCILSKDGKVLIVRNNHTYVKVPDGVEIIADDIFSDEDTVEIPRSVSVIGHNNYNPNWKIATDNDNFCVENGVLYNKGKTELLWAIGIMRKI